MKIVRQAIYQHLTGSAPLAALASGGVHYAVAPQGTNFPFVVFSEHLSKPETTLGSYEQDNAVWLIKALAKNSSSKSGAESADEIRELVRELLKDALLNVAPHELIFCRRAPKSGVAYAEKTDDDMVYTAGDFYRIEVKL